ncbi:MAG: c-type cytochrome [Myxococcota bacterium]|jgi:cytochrome c553|nr:c-type cytochrome [Myxococcota bacterium]
MQSTRRTLSSLLALATLIAAAVTSSPTVALAEKFYEDVRRIDQALRTNPNKVIDQAIESCRVRRNAAMKLYEVGQHTRAERRLRHCFDTLQIPLEVKKAVVKVPTPEELRAKAAKEIERALTLQPNAEDGLKIYRECAACHMPEGWGYTTGLVPQLAGQHRQVIIKQLADIRAGNRENPLMEPYSSVESIGGAQAIADVAEYIDTLEITIENGKGDGSDLALGKKLYEANCVRCHGADGAGDPEKYIPRIQAQHYKYLVRQLERMLEGKRKNADPEMLAQVKGFNPSELDAILDYVSRLTPPEELQAPPGWTNPDFAQ